MIWFVVSVSGYAVFWNWVLPLGGGDCKCGRHRFPWFAVWHPKRGRWVLGIVVLAVGGLFGALFWHQYWFWYWAGFETVALAIHEEDKIKRAAKATGRVVIDAYGRLRIQPVPQGV